MLLAMKSESAANEFHTRLYRWSQSDLYRELEEGCPLLAPYGVFQRRIGGLVAWNETLSSSDRKKLSIALTKRATLALREP
jgi:hypothetical protein